MMLSIFSMLFGRLCLYALFIENLFRSTHFLIGVFVFLRLSIMSCLDILEINPLWIALFGNIFFHYVGCLFILFKVKLATSAGSSKKWESSRKTSTSALLTMPEPLTVWITINCGKFFKRWEYQTTWPASWETYMKVRKQQLELDTEQQTGSR